MNTRGERRWNAVAVATLTALAVIAQQVAGKATRDALFLSHHAPTDLPAVMAASAVLSLLVVLGLGKLMGRWSPARAVPAAFVASAALFLMEWWLAAHIPSATAVLVYLHTAALGAALVSGFWSCINERFDPHTARRVIGKIAAGAALGGVIGGALAWQAGKLLPLPALLAVLAALSVVCAIGVVAVGSPARASTAPAAALPSAATGLRALQRVPYLRQMAMMVALIAVAETAIDYVFKARASVSFADGSSLITFFALFYTVAGIATFGIQSALARRALEKIGLTGTVATLPGTIAIGSAIALAAPGLWTISGLRGAGSAIGSSLYRSGYELLYTPLAPEQKRATKALIDVGFDRVGSALGSGLAMLAIAVVPAAAASLLLGVAIAVAAVSILLAGLLHRGYVAALADGLRRGAVSLDSNDAVDAVTRNTLTELTLAIDRERLLAEVAALRRKVGGPLEAAEDAPPAADSARHSEPPDDPLLAAIADVRSRDAARIRKVLAAGPLGPELAAHAIPLLARNDLQRDISTALRGVADHIAGQLVDALVDPQTAFQIRRRIPRVLSACRTQRAADGLVAGLTDERFEVRYRCASALNRITRAEPTIAVSPQAVFAAARREAGVGEHVWKSQRLLDGSPEDEPVFPGATAPTLGRSVEHVFQLLALALDREPLELAFRALGSGDEGLRGTGLEYLENVLPPDIRDALWPYLGDRRLTRGAPRQRDQIVSQLILSLGRLPLPDGERGHRSEGH